jgi:hypothetical protein
MVYIWKYMYLLELMFDFFTSVTVIALTYCWTNTKLNNHYLAKNWLIEFY